MAQLLSIRLVRNDSSTSWGFRLQGGKDFGTPLLIQKVNVGSLAEKAGLQVGDAVIRVNNREVADVRHKDAQDVIVGAGNNFEITIQRGGTSTWKPSVVPVGTVPSPNSFKSASPSPVTKTSLAATNRQSPRICAGFNTPTKPFSPPMNGNYVNENGSIKAIVNKQYNTPVGIYSDESIAETLSAQAEVLAGGVLGVNFKKNEKNYNAESSEVFKMVLEAEKEPKSPEPDALQNGTISPPVSGLRHVSAPQNKTPSSPQTTLPPGQNICADCERLIVGVFVRIKDKNLHVECFKCATCGTSLKNVGYYTINNKLYCDIHAKMVARQNPPGPNLEPVTVAPSAIGASKIISSALSNSTSAPLSPQPALAPVPFHPPRHSPTHVSPPQTQNFPAMNGSKSFSPTNNFSSPISAPKPEISANSLNPDLSHVSYYNPSQKRLPFLKPRNEKTSAFMPVMKTNIQSKGGGESHDSETAEKNLKLETVFESFDQKEDENTLKPPDYCPQKRPSICSQEVSSVMSDKVFISQSLRNVEDQRPESPVPSESADEFEQFHVDICREKHLQLITARPHSVRSISPCERPLTPSQVVVFPPQIPKIMQKTKTQSPILPVYRSRESTPRKEHLEPITKVSPVRDVLKTVSLNDLPVRPASFGGIASMLCTASDRPFTPIEPAKATIFREPVTLPPETAAYLPTKEENCHLADIERSVSPMVFALTTASERSYSPLPTAVKFEDLFTERDEPEEEEKKRPSMADALTVAPGRSYSLLHDENDEKTRQEETNISVPDLSEDPSIILTKPVLKEPPKPIEKPKPVFVSSSSFHINENFPPVEELKAKFEKLHKTSSSVAEKNVRSTPKLEEPAPQKPIPRVYTPTGLHKPINIPHYQQCVKELVARNKTPSMSRKNTPTPSRVEQSRKNTPTPSRNDFSRKNTPTSFEATVSTQQKVFIPELLPETRNSLLKPTVVSFLKQTKDISEKIPPVLGYQPCSIVENLSSFTKVEQCVKTVCERTLKQIQLEQSNNASELSRTEFCSRTCGEVKITQSRSTTPVQMRSRCASPVVKPPSRCASPVVRHPPIRASPLTVNPPKCSSPVAKNLPKCSSPVAKNPPSCSSPVTRNPPKCSSPAIKDSSQCCRAFEHPIPEFSTSKCQSPKPKPPSRPSTPVTKPSQTTNVTASVQQKCQNPPTGTLTKTLATAQITRNLSKTLSALTSNFSSKNLSTSNTNTSSDPNLTGSTIGGGAKGGTSAGFSAPRRGKGVWNPQNSAPGARIPLCAQCSSQIRGPFITALGKIWCPDHFVCVNQTCKRSLLDIGFVEEPTGLYCEYCFEQFLAPTCGKCSCKIKGDCLNAIGKHFHPECFSCAFCSKKFGNSPFFLEEGLPYCENDWNELFTTKCFACGFPIEAGDRWVEALNNNYHSPCFNCTMCKTNLEGQSFYAKGGRPFCKTHAR